MRRLLRLLLLCSLLASVVLIAPSAHACSCAQQTIAEALESPRSDAEAVAIVRRIDDGSSIDGRVEVVEVLRADRRGAELPSELPSELPVTFDSGASCQPFIAVGDVAGLLVDTSGAAPVVGGCSLLDDTSVQQHLRGDLTVDPMARGPAALAISGPMPGAGLALLDDHLRTLAVADTEDLHGSLVACGGTVAMLRSVEDAENIGLDGEIATFSAVDLQPGPTVAQPGLLNRSVNVLGCLDGRLALVHNASYDEGGGEFGATGGGLLHPDVLSDVQPIQLPGFDYASTGGDRIALLTASADEGSQVLVLDGNGTVINTIEVPGERLYATELSPDGRTIAAWGQGWIHVALDVASGAVLGRVQATHEGWFGHGPWLDDQRLALYEPAEHGQSLTPGTATVLDRNMQQLQSFPMTAGFAFATGAGLLSVTADGLAQLRIAENTWTRDDGRSVRTAAPQTSLAERVAALGRLAEPPQPDPADALTTVAAQPTANAERTGDADDDATGIEVGSQSPVGGAAAAAGVGLVVASSLAGLVVLVRRREE